jgi:hypothetical protein
MQDKSWVAFFDEQLKRDISIELVVNSDVPEIVLGDIPELVPFLGDQTDQVQVVFKEHIAVLFLPLPPHLPNQRD